MSSPATSAKHYESNPFTITFQALSRLFDANAIWAVVLIIFNMIGFFFQGISNIANLTSNNSGSPNYSVSTSTSASNPDISVIIAIIVLVVILLAVVLVIGITINVFLNGMFSYVALQSEKGKQVSFGEAFNATLKRFWVLLSAQLLAIVKIFGWTLLLIVPGVIAAMRYALLPYLIMTEDAVGGAGDAHQRIKHLTKGRLWEVFGISTVAAIIPVIGPVLGLSGKAALYGQLASHSEKPKIHWLNYLGLLLIGLLLFIVSLVGLIVFLVSTTN